MRLGYLLALSVLLAATTGCVERVEVPAVQNDPEPDPAPSPTPRPDRPRDESDTPKEGADRDIVDPGDVGETGADGGVVDPGDVTEPVPEPAPAPAADIGPTVECPFGGPDAVVLAPAESGLDNTESTFHPSGALASLGGVSCAPSQDVDAPAGFDPLDGKSCVQTYECDGCALWFTRDAASGFYTVRGDEACPALNAEFRVIDRIPDCDISALDEGHGILGTRKMISQGSGRAFVLPSYGEDGQLTAIHSLECTYIPEEPFFFDRFACWDQFDCGGCITTLTQKKEDLSWSLGIGGITPRSECDESFVAYYSLSPQLPPPPPTPSSNPNCGSCLSTCGTSPNCIEVCNC